MVPAGIFISLLGLIGLVYCIAKAFRARRSGVEGEALVAELKALVPINLGAFFLSVIGLMLIVLGIIL